MDVRGGNGWVSEPYRRERFGWRDIRVTQGQGVAHWATVRMLN